MELLYANDLVLCIDGRYGGAAGGEDSEMDKENVGLAKVMKREAR